MISAEVSCNQDLRVGLIALYFVFLTSGLCCFVLPNYDTWEGVDLEFFHTDISLKLVESS